MIDGALHGFGISGFDEARALMQDVPHDFAESVGDGPDSLNVTELNHEAVSGGRSRSALW